MSRHVPYAFQMGQDIESEAFSPQDYHTFAGQLEADLTALQAGGHLRIELRALPAGPTVADMLANAAFVLGLTLGMRPRIGALLGGLTFGQARRNFYAAARHGLEAELLWLCPSGLSPQPLPAGALIEQLIPVAHAGLLAAGVEPAEAGAQLAVIAARVRSGQTGAVWQQRTLAMLERELPRPQALAAMLERYLTCAATAAPVHSWPCA